MHANASLVRERLKSYPRVSEISLSCTPHGVRFYISSVLMRFLCNTSLKDSCAWPCLTWHCQPIKSAEYNQRETTIVSNWKPYLQQYTQIIKTPTLQTYFSYILSKLKRTRNQMTSDLYVLNWKSSYDVMLLMYQRRQQHLRPGICNCKNTFLCSVLHWKNYND